MSYDTRAFGDFGWQFVNAGEQYRRLDGVTPEERLMMCGIFKQATMGDCLVEEARKGDLENAQRAEWLKHKGMDTFVAMQLYIEKVRELAKVYQERELEN
uniref:Diazepam-binding inhibitor-like 5 n=1 Tax=Aceria tosichella TaxID=561515 RepID=A0A6G1S6R4_9ACAR